MRRSQELGAESQQMYELNKRLESYLARVKFLEQENELLKEEIQQRQLEQAKTSWKSEYKKELRELRETLDELYRDKSHTELERERLYDELLLVKERWQKEKEEQELVKEKVKESKWELEEEKRAQNWLKQKALQLEGELQLLQDAQEEEKLTLQQEVSERSYSFIDLQAAPTSSYPVIEVKEYTSQLSEIWKGAVRSYQEEIEQMEASLLDAKEQLQSIAREKKEAYQLLQNLQRELDSLQVHKEMLEKSVMKQEQEQQDFRQEFQSEVNSLEDEKEELRQQIVQILKDRQKLMELKISLSLEVATYRTLLEAESIRLQPFMEYSPASVIKDTKLDMKSYKLPSLSNNVTDVRRKFGSTESRINVTSMHRGVSVTPQPSKSQPELLKTALVNKFQGTTSLSKNLQKEPTARHEPAIQRTRSSVTQKATSKRASSTLNSVKSHTTATVKETLSESFSHDSSKPLGFQPLTYETKFPRPSDKPAHVDGQGYTNFKEKLTTRAEVDTEKKTDDLTCLVKTDQESDTVSPAETQIIHTVQDTYYGEKLITDALDKAFETLKGADEDIGISSASTFTNKNAIITQSESVNDDFSCQMEAKKDVVAQSSETLDKPMSSDNWENKNDEHTAEFLEPDKETEKIIYVHDDQHAAFMMSIESDIPEPSMSIPVHTYKTEDTIHDMTPPETESEECRTVQVTSESTVTVNQEVRFTTSSEYKDIEDDASAHVNKMEPLAFSADIEWQSNSELHEQLETEKDADNFIRNHASSDNVREDTDEMVCAQPVIKSFSSKLLDGREAQDVESIPEESKDSVIKAQEDDLFRSDKQAMEDWENPTDSQVTNEKGYDAESININSAEVSDANRPADDDILVLHKQKVKEIFSGDEGVRSESTGSETDEVQYVDGSETTMKKEQWQTERKVEDSNEEVNSSESPSEEDVNKVHLPDMKEPREGINDTPFPRYDAEHNEPLQTISVEEYFTIQHFPKLSKYTMEIDSAIQPSKDISEGEENRSSNITEAELCDKKTEAENIPADKDSRNKNFVLDDACQQEESIGDRNVASYHDDESIFETRLAESLNNVDMELKEQEKDNDSIVAPNDECDFVTDIQTAVAQPPKDDSVEAIQEDIKGSTEIIPAATNSDENIEYVKEEECLYLNKENVLATAEEKEDKEGQEETEEMGQPIESDKIKVEKGVQQESKETVLAVEHEETKVDEVIEESKVITLNSECEEQHFEEEEAKEDEESEKESLKIYKLQSLTAEDQESEEEEGQEINKAKAPSTEGDKEEEEDDEEDLEASKAKAPSAEVEDTEEDEEKQESLEIRKTESSAEGGEEEEEDCDVNKAKSLATEGKEEEDEDECLQVNKEKVLLAEAKEREDEEEDFFEINKEKMQEAEGKNIEDEEKEQSLELSKEKSPAQEWKEADDEEEENLEINKETVHKTEHNEVESEENEEEVLLIHKEKVPSAEGKEENNYEEIGQESGKKRKSMPGEADEEDIPEEENLEMSEVVSDQTVAVSSFLDNDKEKDNIETKPVDGEITVQAVPARDEETVLSAKEETEFVLISTEDEKNEKITLLTKEETESVSISTNETSDETSWITEEVTHTLSNAPYETKSFIMEEEQFDNFQASVENILSDEEKVYVSTTLQEETGILDGEKQRKEEETSENSYVEQLTIAEPKQYTEEFITSEGAAEIMLQSPPLDSLQDSHLAPLIVNRHGQLSADLDVDFVPSEDDFSPVHEKKHEEVESETNILVQDFGDDASIVSKSTVNLLNDNYEMSSKECDDEVETYNSATLKEDMVIRREGKVSEEVSVMPNEDTSDTVHLEGCLSDDKHEAQTISLDNDSESTEDDESPNASKAYQAPKHDDEEGSEVIVTSDDENQSHEEESTPDYTEGHTTEYTAEENIINDTLPETELRSDKVLQLGSATANVSEAGEETHPEETSVDSDSDKHSEDITVGMHSFDMHSLAERNVLEELTLNKQVEGLTVHEKEITTDGQQLEEQNADAFTKVVSEPSITINGIHLDEDMDEQDFINGSRENTVPDVEKELPTVSKLRSSEETQDKMIHEYGEDAIQTDSVAKVFLQGPTENLSQQDVMSETPLQICLNASDDDKTNLLEKNNSADQWAQEDALNLEEFTLSGKDKKESSETVAII